MITLKRLNVVRQVATEERAAKLEALGFTRVSSKTEEAKPPKGGKDAPKGGKDANKDGKDAPKGGKDANKDGKEGQDGGTDQPGGGDGAK